MSFLDLNTPLVNSPGRKATRYVRKDVKIYFEKYSLFNLGKRIEASLVNISSGGILVYCPHDLRLNRKVLITAKFQDGKEFPNSATIIRKEKKVNFRYILSFDKKLKFPEDDHPKILKVSIFDSQKKIAAKYRELTFTGVQILTTANIDKTIPLTAVIALRDKPPFQTGAKITHKNTRTVFYYAMKFDKFDNALGDHITDNPKETVFFIGNAENA